MRLFLDDERPTPEGWKRAYTAKDCIFNLQYMYVEELSLDHDLGAEENGTGYDVVLWIEEQVFTNPFYNPPKQIYVHSSNSSARQKMLAGIERINRQLNI